MIKTFFNFCFYFYRRFVTKYFFPGERCICFTLSFFLKLGNTNIRYQVRALNENIHFGPINFFLANNIFTFKLVFMFEFLYLKYFDRFFFFFFFFFLIEKLFLIESFFLNGKTFFNQNFF